MAIGFLLMEDCMFMVMLSVALRSGRKPCWPSRRSISAAASVCFAQGFEVLGFGGEVGALGIEHFQEIELTVLETNGGRVARPTSHRAERPAAATEPLR